MAKSPERELRERLLAAVDGCRFAAWDRRKFRLYVWASGGDVVVFDEFGYEQERWPISNDMVPSPVTAELTVAERTNAGY